MKPEYLGLAPFSNFRAQAVRRNQDFANERAGLTNYLQKRNRPNVRCGKCNGRKTRAHAHGCPKRGMCHAGFRLRKYAQSIFYEMGDRRTGRTTRNLYAALVTACSEGAAFVMVADERERKRCQRTIDLWAPHENRLKIVTPKFDGAGEQSAKIFVDHQAYDAKNKINFVALLARRFVIA